jgi:methionyl-tRNA formyltransferase
LKPEIFNIPKLGAINIHPSLLPKYRGLSPHHQVLIHGESLSGVCIHYIEEGIDTGDIIALEKFEISSNDYIANVQFKMLDIYKRLIIKAISNIEDENFIPTPQQQSNASYFGKLKKTDFEIDVHKSKEEIYNLIRAVSLPYNGAVLDKYKVWSARVPDHQEEERLLKKFKEERFLKDSAQDLLIIRANNGLLISDDFEIINI